MAAVPPVILAGADGNPFTSRDIEGADNNHVRMTGVMLLSGNYTAQANGGTPVDASAVVAETPSSGPLALTAYSMNGMPEQYVFKFAPTTGVYQLVIFVGGVEQTNATPMPQDEVIWEGVTRKLL